MKNHEIVRAWPKLKLLKSELEWTREQLARLEKQSQQLQREINVLECVDTVIDGVAVSETESKTIYGKDYKINAVGSDNTRNAEVYANARTSENGVGRDWGLKFRIGYGTANEDWRNTGWAFKDAVEAARRWVVHGEKMNEAQEQLFLTRHQYDPEGRAPRKRREAFEAAWLAGQKELAIQILTGRAKLPTKRGPREQPETAT